MTNNAQAHLCVKKGRVKMYSDKAYLQNKQEFEIELYNPTNCTKLAKIYINGKPLSSSGVVLKPGQRVFLERHIDTPKKFLFETYEVDGSSTTQKAIENNGEIKVEFYDEYTPPVTTWTTNYSYTIPQYIHQSDLNNQFFYSSGTMSSDYTRSTKSLVGRKMSASLGEPTRCMDSVETGRVEKGSSSNQSFSQYEGNFNSWTSTSVAFKILPLSAKPVEVQDLVLYCTNCGTKQKKNNKFCPSCGNKH